MSFFYCSKMRRFFSMFLAFIFLLFIKFSSHYCHHKCVTFRFPNCYPVNSAEFDSESVFTGRMDYYIKIIEVQRDTQTHTIKPTHTHSHTLTHTHTHTQTHPRICTIFLYPQVGSIAREIFPTKPEKVFRLEARGKSISIPRPHTLYSHPTPPHFRMHQ